MSGDYADLCCERDLMNDIYSADDPEDVFDCWGTPTIYTRSSKKEKKPSIFMSDDTLPEFFKVNEDILLRRDKKDQSGYSFDEVVVIKNITPKAVLFQIAQEWATDSPYKGREFWEPRSILSKLDNEAKVVHLPHWANIILLGIDIPI